MFFSGIADESGPTIETQINAQQELGWNHIEIRLVEGTQFTDVDDGTFETIAGKLADAKMQVSCFASGIANWATPVTTPFEQDIDALERSIPRMRSLGCPFIRVMSWPQGNTGADEWKAEAIRRMKELAARAEAGGITLVLENCDGWAAQSSKHMVEYLETIDSSALRVVFDTGNAPAHGHHSLEWYTAVKPWISYVHIKDTYKDSDGVTRVTWPNLGHGYVRQILTDLLRDGYDGGVSIEPHVASQVHLNNMGGADPKWAFDSYVRYGRMLAELVGGVRETL